MSRSRNSRWRATLAAGLCLLAAACGNRAITSAGSHLTLGAGEYRVPVRNMVERRYLTVVRQQYDFSCGSAALATLLRYHYGDMQTEQSVFMGMWQQGDREQIRRLGFSLLDMKRYLNARNIRADGFLVNLAQIEKTRVPGIALVDLKGYKHFVVVKGVENGRVLLGDPSRGIRTIDAREFSKSWNGILFALGTDVERAKESFGTDREWGLVARARFDGIIEPAGLQALAITRAPPYPVEM